MKDVRRLVWAFQQLDREDRVEILRENNLVPPSGHVPDGEGREFRVWCMTAFTRAQRGYRPAGGEYVPCGDLDDVRASVRRRLDRSDEAREVGILDG